MTTSTCTACAAGGMGRYMAQFKRKRPSRRRWRKEAELRAKSQALRAKLSRPRVLGHRDKRVLGRMGQLARTPHYTPPSWGYWR